MATRVMFFVDGVRTHFDVSKLEVLSEKTGHTIVYDADSPCGDEGSVCVVTKANTIYYTATDEEGDYSRCFTNLEGVL